MLYGRKQVSHSTQRVFQYSAIISLPRQDTKTTKNLLKCLAHFGWTSSHWHDQLMFTLIIAVWCFDLMRLYRDRTWIFLFPLIISPGLKVILRNINQNKTKRTDTQHPAPDVWHHTEPRLNVPQQQDFIITKEQSPKQFRVTCLCASHESFLNSSTFPFWKQCTLEASSSLGICKRPIFNLKLSLRQCSTVSSLLPWRVYCSRLKMSVHHR